MSISLQQKRCAISACILVIFLATSVRADFGPKPIHQVRVDVTLDGQPIGDHATGVLLVPIAESEAVPTNAAKKGPGLEIPYVDSEGQKWSYGGNLWGGRFKDGAVDFSGFYMLAGGMPSRVRLAVVLPQSGQQFVTNAVSPARHYAILRAELSTEGSAELRRVATPIWERLDFLKALLITLLVECLLVAVIVVRGRPKTDHTGQAKRVSIRRVVFVCIIVNFLTLPVVWLVTGHYLYECGLPVGLVVFAGMEIAVYVAEGTAYGLLTRTGWRTAFLATLIANLTTCMLGFVL